MLVFDETPIPEDHTDQQCGCETDDGFEMPPGDNSAESELPVFTVDEIADQLTDGFWSGFGGPRKFDIVTGDTLEVNLTGLTSDGANMARLALEAWTAVSGINFTEITSSGADITFDDNNSGAYASSSVSGGRIVSSFVNIDANWAGGSNRVDGYYFQTYLHEIGHALGLGHAGNYNGGATYGVDNHYQNDSWQASVMSYFHQTENPFIDADFAYVITPMIADIQAIHNLYGAPSSQEGDTIYGKNSNTGTYLDGALDLSRSVTFTVYDTGGTDLFDFSDYTSHQIMDLRIEGISSLAGLDGNIVIARGTVIENGKTGGGNDVIFGNDVDNNLLAGIGRDTVQAGGGNDAVGGGAGDDDLGGGDGFDFIEGGSGSDIITGDDGNDLVFGDEVTLATLIDLFPGWEPPADAQDLLDAGELLAIWDDIQADQFAMA